MSKEKVIITGAKGQLGSDVIDIFTNAGYEVFGFGKEELDITDNENVEKIILDVKPDIIIHSAAFTAVDLAESEKDLAFKINAIGTRNIAIAADKVNAKLVYISTDYVFNGSGTEPYNEYMPTSPLGTYGASKLAGEKFVTDFHRQFFIVRTSWVYGKNGKNFVKTMLNLAKDHKEISVVNDQRGCPTYTVDLAVCLLELVKTQKYGVYHVSNSGSCTWYEFATAIFKEKNIDIKVNPVTSAEFPRPARRPSYSVFDHMGLRLNNFSKMRDWNEALIEFLENV
jgi:dTDP-4-dehydrorhamnose reductase